VRRVRKILSMSPTLQAEALCREGRGLIIELMKLGQQFFADEVLARLTDSLVESSVQRRRLAIETLLSIAPVVEEGSPREGLEIGVRQALDRESDPRVYSQLTHLAASMADSRLHKGEVNQALRLLDVLKKHSVIKDAAFPERQHLVMPALEKVTAGEGYKAVAEKVKAVDTASERLQRAIDATALRFLISEMKNIESFAERVRVGETISKVGDAAAAVLSEEVQNASMPLEALRLLEVMPRLVSEAMAENALGGFVIAHPVLSVRRRAAQMMVEKGSPRAEEVLLLMFGAGSDPAVRAAFADALGRLKTPAAIRALSETAGSREEDENLRGAACAGLGRTGDPQVVPLLLSLAEKASKGLTRFFRSVSPAVRIAAYRALAAFPGDDRAREALQRGAEDSDAAVKAAVGQILKGVATRSASEVIRMVQGGDSGTTSGMLDEQGITPVCRAIAQEGRTGVLRVNSEGVQGSIHFRAGKATVAECGELKGKPAMDRLIAMKKGIYLFKAETPAPGGPPPA
jgi:HEAT repeat protein